MFKKATAILLSFGLIIGGATSVSAATTASNDVNATINGGSLELTVDQTPVNLTADIDHTLDVMDVTADKMLAYNAIDNRGVEEKSDVQITLAPFVHSEDASELTLHATSDMEYDVPKVIDNLDPSNIDGAGVVKEVSGQIDLNGLKFATGGFVKAGNYTSTLTTEIIASPMP